MQELLAIESVARRDQEKPFGNGVAQALDYTLSLCQRMGFHTKNANGCTAAAYRALFGSDVYGKKLGIAMTSPDSGSLSMNVGLLRVEDGLIRLSVDIRHPETAAADHIAETVRRAVEPYGFTLAPIHPEKSVYQDKNGPVMQSLLAAYRQETGDLSAPLAIGGGTYAKAMENIIAFGPVFPGEESREHQADEYIALDNIERLRRIYAQAFQNLLAL